MKKTIKFILIILWLMTIFIFSNMPSKESNEKSKDTIETTLEKSVKITNQAGITDKHPSKSRIKKIVKTLNKPLRKCAHATVYFVLAILIMSLLKEYDLETRKEVILTIIFCFLYACTDEFHQLFVKERNANFVDCLIDTAGSAIGCGFYIMCCNFIKINKKFWRCKNANCR